MALPRNGSPDYDDSGPANSTALGVSSASGAHDAFSGQPAMKAAANLELGFHPGNEMVF